MTPQEQQIVQLQNINAALLARCLDAERRNVTAYKDGRVDGIDDVFTQLELYEESLISQSMRKKSTHRERAIFKFEASIINIARSRVYADLRRALLKAAEPVSQ